MTRKTRLTAVLSAAVLALALLLSYCVPPPQVSFRCAAGPAYKPGETLPTNPFFVLGQVILTGGSQDMEKMVAELASRDIPLTLYEGCTFSGLAELPALEQEGRLPLRPGVEAGDAPNPFFAPANGRVELPGGQDLALNLYRIEGDKTVEDAVQAVAELSRDIPVYADPNYLTGHLAGSPCSSPFGVEGSPFGVEGSPFGVEGSPHGGQGVPAEEKDFWQQWAFGEINLKAPGERSSERTGAGVQLAIFDTSPFTITGAADTVEPIPLVDAPFDLNIHHPFDLPLLDVSAAAAPAVDVRDHGLFAAGLAHAVALDSPVHLYRVLDANGCGDLFLLAKTLKNFAAIQGGRPQRERSVINLSLGIQKPRRLDAAGFNDAQGEIASKGDAVLRAYQMAQTELGIESLHTALLLARQSGAVVVAAAGNDSVRDAKILGADVPAAYDFVLGVEARGPKNVPACYSNQGDVAAPGGQARLDPSDDGSDATVPHCVPLAAACPTDSPGPGCPYGLISITATPRRYGYSYWVGSSFAAPLVSGLAALHYQTLSPPQVISAIQGAAAVPPAPGLIQVP